MLLGWLVVLVVGSIRVVTAHGDESSSSPIALSQGLRHQWSGSMPAVILVTELHLRMHARASYLLKSPLNAGDGVRRGRLNKF